MGIAEYQSPVILSAAKDMGIAEYHSPVIMSAAKDMGIAEYHSPVILSAAKDMGIADPRSGQIPRESYSERPQILRCGQDDNSEWAEDDGVTTSSPSTGLATQDWFARPMPFSFFEAIL